MAGMKDVFVQLARITRGQLTKAGVPANPRLETLLAKLDDGQAEELGSLPGALIASAGSRLYAPNFFARDPAEVAEALCGSALSYADRANTSWSGLVLETAAYKTFTVKDEATAKAAPGTLGLYPSQGKHILIISAHEQGKYGTVAIWGLGAGENLSMTKVTEALGANGYTGSIMGVNSPLYLQPRDCTNNKVGNLKVKSTGKQKGADASYKLTRE